jgi:hypothetical protein
MKAEDDEVDEKQFRIGNLVLRDGKVDTITGIWHELSYDSGYDFYIQAGDDLDYPIEDISGIPLTEEILIKMGFFKKNRAWMLVDQGTNPTKFKFSIWEDLTYNTGELQPPLDFVHQLQNLYQSLTGEELTINFERE